MSDTLSATMARPREQRLDFDGLYRTTRGDVYAYVASLVGDRATAEDVVAIAFERAYRRRKAFRPARGSARQWLFGIARNAALDELSRRGRAALPVAEVYAVDEVDAATDGDGSVDERSLAVRAALAALSPRERELVALKFYAGLTNAEIAATLGISESNAGTRLHRALGSLREALS